MSKFNIQEYNNSKFYFVNEALNEASKSTNKKHSHGCVIVKGGKIISRGYNDQNKHAEINALKKLTLKTLKGVSLYVVRKKGLYIKG